MARRVATCWALVVGALAVVAVYYSFDPAEAGFFPPCPVYACTGYRCAGCGSQRALHALLHGELADAWHLNPLLMIALPYVALGYVAEWRAPESPFWSRFRKTGYGHMAVWVVLVGVVVWSVLRNIW